VVPTPEAALLRGEDGAHCSVDGNAGMTAKRLIVPLAVGEHGGFTCDSRLDGVMHGMSWRAGARGASCSSLTS
jgi:hypothetical protein